MQGSKYTSNRIREWVSNGEGDAQQIIEDLRRSNQEEHEQRVLEAETEQVWSEEGTDYDAELHTILDPDSLCQYIRDTSRSIYLQLASWHLMQVP